MPLSRRDFLVRTGAAGLAVGLAGTVESLFTSLPAAGARGPAQGYGPLVPDPAGVLDLPQGVRYRILSRAGPQMPTGGGPAPSRFDGMGRFRAAGGRPRLVPSHEVGPGAPHPVPAAGQA